MSADRPMLSSTTTAYHTSSATRYVTAIALSISIWDHLLIMENEVQLVWNQPWTVLQTLLVLNRYGAEASILFISFAVGWWKLVPSNGICEATVGIQTIYCIINSASSQFSLLFYLYNIWDDRKKMKYILATGFAICFGASIAFAILNFYHILGSMSPHLSLPFCVLPPRTYYELGMWSGMVLYDIYVLALMLLNALHKPRRQDSEILTNLMKDGGYIFLACFGLRMIQLLLSLSSSQMALDVTPVIAWAVDNILSFRLFLKMKAVETKARERFVPMTDNQSVYVFKEVEVEML